MNMTESEGEVVLPEAQPSREDVLITMKAMGEISPEDDAELSFLIEADPAISKRIAEARASLHLAHEVSGADMTEDNMKRLEKDRKKLWGMK